MAQQGWVEEGQRQMGGDQIKSVQQGQVFFEYQDISVQA